MSYGHAEANLRAIRMLNQETEELLRKIALTDPEFASQLLMNSTAPTPEGYPGSASSPPLPLHSRRHTEYAHLDPRQPRDGHA